MIQEAYCSFEVSKVLKEKGFVQETLMAYNQNGNFMPNGAIEDTYQIFYPAPTHQLAMAWLREEHKLHIGIARGPKGYHITIETIPLGVVKYITREIVGTNYVDSYEEAVEAALKCILENLI